MLSFVLSAATCIPVLWWMVVYSQRLILGSLCPLHLQIEIERERGEEEKEALNITHARFVLDPPQFTIRL